MPKRPQERQILRYPFVYPVYWSDEGIRFGDDNFPLPVRKRLLGHETATATSAVELVRFTDHVGFFPNLVTRDLVAREELRILSLKESKPVQQPLFLTVKNEFIRQKTFMEFRELLQAALEA